MGTMLLRDRTVIVTGASAGIGRSTAALLARSGAHVLAVARNGDALDELAREHPTVEPLMADLGEPAGREAVMERAEHVDVLVSNAARGFTGLVEEMTLKELEAIFDLNVLATIDLTLRVLPQMLERRSGNIVVVGSILGYAATPPLTAYAASKFALQGFTEGLRREVATRGVKVSLITPGAVNTRFLGRTSREEVGTDLPARLLGVPPILVAAAVLRTITLAPLPGYTTVAVPRAAGLARLAALPGVARLVDTATALAARPLRTGG